MATHNALSGQCGHLWGGSLYTFLLWCQPPLSSLQRTAIICQSDPCLSGSSFLLPAPLHSPYWTGRKKWGLLFKTSPPSFCTFAGAQTRPGAGWSGKAGIWGTLRIISWAPRSWEPLAWCILSPLSATLLCAGRFLLERVLKKKKEWTPPMQSWACSKSW